MGRPYKLQGSADRKFIRSVDWKRNGGAPVYGRVYGTHEIVGDAPFVSTFWESGSADIHQLDGGSDTPTRGDGTYPGYLVFPTGDARSQSRYLIRTGVVGLTSLARGEAWRSE